MRSWIGGSIREKHGWLLVRESVVPIVLHPCMCTHSLHTHTCMRVCTHTHTTCTHYIIIVYLFCSYHLYYFICDSDTGYTLFTQEDTDCYCSDKSSQQVRHTSQHTCTHAHTHHTNPHAHTHTHTTQAHTHTNAHRHKYTHLPISTGTITIYHPRQQLVPKTFEGKERYIETTNNALQITYK